MKDNRLIAEFMGFHRTKKGYIVGGFGDGTFGLAEELHFHTSWDWLMPVIAKIVEDYGEGWSFEEGYDLEVRYQSVVNFIKECNDER